MRSSTSIRPRALPGPSSTLRSRSARRSWTCGGRHPTKKRSSISRPPSRWRARTSMPIRSSGSAATSATARSITLSVHPHNDRGTAVAATELAVMAGRGTGGRHALRQWRAHRQCRYRHLGAQSVQPGDRSRAGDHRHRRDRPHRRALQSASGASTASLCRRARLHRFLGLASGRDQKRLRGARQAQRSAMGSAVPADRSEGSGPLPTRR